MFSRPSVVLFVSNSYLTLLSSDSDVNAQVNVIIVKIHVSLQSLYKLIGLNSQCKYGNLQAGSCPTKTNTLLSLVLAGLSSFSPERSRKPNRLAPVNDKKKNTMDLI